MANTWLTVGQINRAVDVYSRILARYPGSREAREAADKILALAQTHEHEGRYHLAMGLYDKLERLA
jgi:tetratricopeptide (TPR) repeat protein